MSDTTKNTNVWLFYPNLIGYGRIITAFLSFEAMPYAPLRSALWYALSALLDAVDGHIARMFNQSDHLIRVFVVLCTRFGAMLDQLVDRCTTLAMVMCLCAFYPKYLFLFQLSAIIDIASHWLHLHATDLTQQTTHKVMASSNPILHLYY
ncbi:unnamed protein product, partial [Anisakis simplex]|uniref:CDP-diacylglycerol--inositol 3-phosphatidyltransferase (inferred by orthology to a human protein) n=1 Tax=Anisakis simplex TaxID=6269 RepID=A0A0M3JAN5_ANISI